VTLTTLAIVLLIGSFLASAVLTAVVRRLSLRASFVAHPVDDRYHSRVVPLGGGIAIFSTVVLFLGLAVVAVRFLVSARSPGWLAESVTEHSAGFLDKVPELLVVLVCITALFAIGLWDDRRRFAPAFKLVVEFAIALVAALLADIRAELFMENTLLTSVLSAFWIVLVINAFNFLDNMDGAAAGIGIIIAVILFTAAAAAGQVFVGAMAMLFVGALSGFLVFNFPPAKIFMGDAGSLPAGFILALLTLRTTYYHQAQSGAWYAVLIPLIAMAVPLYDFTSVTLLRIAQGKSPFVGDTQHFSHRLKRHGLTDRQVALTLYLATACTGLGATFLYQVDLAGATLIFLQTIMILAVIAIFESTAKIYPPEAE